MEEDKQKSGEAEVALGKLKIPVTGLLDEGRIGQYFRTGWRTFKQYPLGFMTFSLLMLIVQISVTILSKKIYIIGFLVGIAIRPLFMGDYIVSAKLLQKQSCKFSDFFSIFHYYQPLIMYTFIYGTISYIQYLSHDYFSLRLLCGLTSMVFSVLFLFTPLIIIDRLSGFWQALLLSRRTVMGNLFGILVFLFFMVLILGVPIITFLYGLFIAKPILSGSMAPIPVALPVISFATIAIIISQSVVTCAITAAYADLFGLQSEKY